MKKMIRNTYILQIIPAAILTLVCLFIASYGYSENIFSSYFKDVRVLAMNFVPVYLILVIISLVVKSVPIGFGITSIFMVAMAYTHEKKVIYRSEPLMLSDLKLVREAMSMSKSYNVAPDRLSLIAIGIVVILLIVLIFLCRNLHWNFRWIGFAIYTMCLVVFINTLAFDDKLYFDIGKESSGLNMWVYLESYEAKGIVYPFLHSIKTSKNYKYKAYDKKRAEELLSKYEYKNIPDDKKVDIILLQLESFKDFYMYRNDALQFNYDPYDYFHKLQSESITGSLMVNTFGGGTFITETNVATGNRNNPIYNVNKNSYIWYLKSQGYKAIGTHPNVGTFYNRVNAYKHLGFDEFHDMENTYKEVSDEILFDRDYFPYIIKDHDDAEGQPYVSLNVSYQGHGPYNREVCPDNPGLKWNDSYDVGNYNYFNNYLNLIHDTNYKLKMLVDNFEKSDRPIVLVFWGDHSPSMGEGNSIFKMFNINCDMATPDGLYNIYATPYVIWANSKAKELTGNSFVGEGPTMEPAFLMNYLFRQLGYEGDEYNQFLTDFTQDVTVIKQNLTLYKGEFKPTTDPEVSERLKDFYNVEYNRMKNKVQVDK